MAANRQSSNGGKCESNMELMKLSAAGDTNAFRRLVDRNNPEMRAVLTYRLNGDEEKAKDVSQEVWIKVWDNLSHHRLRKDGSADGWMTRMMYNELKDILKKEKHRLQPVRMTDELYEVIEETYGAPDKGEQEFEVRQGLEAAEQYMLNLLVRIVNYHILDDMTIKQIARKMHKSERWVKDKWEEGIKELQENMVKLEEVPIH